MGEVSALEEQTVDGTKEQVIEPEESREESAVFYDTYTRMTPLETAQACGFDRIGSHQVMYERLWISSLNRFMSGEMEAEAGHGRCGTVFVFFLSGNGIGKKLRGEIYSC